MITTEGHEENEGAPLAAGPAEAVVSPDPDLPNEPLTPLDALDERFALRPMRFGRDEQGMPTHLVDEQKFVPSLSTESLVCLADCSKFVVRDDWGTVVAEFTPDEVERCASGRYRVTRELFEKKFGEAEARQVTADMERPADERLVSNVHIEVEPVRPQCKHYMAQMTESMIVGARRQQWRLCTARRDTSGAFMDVGDLRLSACSLRSPRDFQSEAQLSEMDSEIISAGQNREYLPMLGGQLEAAGGLFGNVAVPADPHAAYFAPPLAAASEKGTLHPRDDGGFERRPLATPAEEKR